MFTLGLMRTYPQSTIKTLNKVWRCSSIVFVNFEQLFGNSELFFFLNLNIIFLKFYPVQTFLRSSGVSKYLHLKNKKGVFQFSLFLLILSFNI